MYPPFVDCPKVTFITVNFKMKEYVRALLKGMEIAHVSIPFEYILVDNASEDGIGEMIREQFPWVRYIASSKNIGFGAGNNIGIREARGEYVVLLNPDLVIVPGQFEPWIDWMDAHPRVGISGPRLLNPDGTDQQSCFRFYHWTIPFYRRTMLGKTPWGKKALRHFRMDDMDRNKEQKVDCVLGAAMMVRQDLLRRLGGIDERFFLYFEDTDLCRRAWKEGYEVMYTPVAKLFHYYQRQSHVHHVWDILTNRAARIHIMSGIRYFLKYWNEPNPHVS